MKAREAAPEIAWPEFDCSAQAAELVALVAEHGPGQLYHDNVRGVWRMCGEGYKPKREEAKVCDVGEAVTAAALRKEMEHWLRFTWLLSRCLSSTNNPHVNPRPKPDILATV